MNQAAAILKRTSTDLAAPKENTDPIDRALKIYDYDAKTGRATAAPDASGATSGLTPMEEDSGLDDDAKDAMFLLRSAYSSSQAKLVRRERYYVCYLGPLCCV